MIPAFHDYSLEPKISKCGDLLYCWTFKDQIIRNGLFSAFFANKFVLQTQLDLHSALVVFQVLDAIQFEHNIQNLGLHRGAFCQFPFRWIYYCHSSVVNPPERKLAKRTSVDCDKLVNFDMITSYRNTTYITWNSWRSWKILIFRINSDSKFYNYDQKLRKKMSTKIGLYFIQIPLKNV